MNTTERNLIAKKTQSLDEYNDIPEMSRDTETNVIFYFKEDQKIITVNSQQKDDKYAQHIQVCPTYRSMPNIYKYAHLFTQPIQMLTKCREMMDGAAMRALTL